MSGHKIKSPGIFILSFASKYNGKMTLKIYTAIKSFIPLFIKGSEKNDSY